MTGGTRRSAAAKAVPYAIGCTLLVVASCAPDDRFQFGFRATWDVPCELVEECHVGHGCGAHDALWFAGPRDAFDEREPAQLARESLAWFESSDESAAWRGNASARLELTYPSGALDVTVGCSAAPSWPEELRAWFERFPPGGDGLDDSGTEFYVWEIDFGERTSVRGDAESDADAVTRMSALLVSIGSDSPFQEPSCSLTWVVRRDPHRTDVYCVDEVSAADVDTLPQQLREKIAHYTRD